MSSWSYSPSAGRLQHETVAIVLGGGRGTRLFPLTRDRSKPAVPLGGKFRFIDIALSNSINSGLRRIFVLTQYNSASLNNHVAFTYKFDSFSKGFVSILAAEQGYEDDQGWFQGTADSVRRCFRYLGDPAIRDVLIMPGDHLCRIDFNRVMALHDARGADVTLCAAVVSREEAAKFRVLKLADDGHVLEYARKPTDPAVLARFRLAPEEKHRYGVKGGASEEGYLAFMGIYLFRKEVLFRLLNTRDDQDLGRDTLPRLLWSTKSYCYVFTDYWRDIGTIRSFYEASMDLTREDPPFRFQHPEAPIYTHGRYLPASRIHNTVMTAAIAADGTVIREARIEHSVIGVRARIESGTRITRSVIFGADAFETREQRAHAIERGVPPLGIGPRCVIERAIIDKNARIGADCRLVNEAGVQEADGENYYIRDGVIIIPKGGVLAPGTVI